jgi:hypothetical protein
LLSQTYIFLDFSSSNIYFTMHQWSCSYTWGKGCFYYLVTNNPLEGLSGGRY